MTNTIKAAANPALANDLLQKAIADEAPKFEPKVTPPSNTTVELPGGYVTPTGEVIRDAEVRELNGLDEEALSKTGTLGKALMILLQRGVVSVVGQKATDTILDAMFAGDREAIILGILKATFGDTCDISTYCKGCQDFKTVAVDLNTDIKYRMLTDPINEAAFIVNGKIGEITVQLPTGVTQKELINNADKTPAEITTLLLENTVVKIGSTPVYSKFQVQNLGVLDRKLIVEELNKRVPGPQFDDVTVECSECGSEVSVPIDLGTLFRF